MEINENWFATRHADTMEFTSHRRSTLHLPFQSFRKMGVQGPFALDLRLFQGKHLCKPDTRFPCVAVIIYYLYGSSMVSSPALILRLLARNPGATGHTASLHQLWRCCSTSALDAGPATASQQPAATCATPATGINILLQRQEGGCVLSNRSIQTSIFFIAFKSYVDHVLWVAADQQGPGGILQQRYAAMVSSGVLRPDQHQQQLVVQLASLLQQLQDYSRQVVHYRTGRAAYEVSEQNLIKS